MIDFACKQFKMDDLIKCAFNLTRSEVKIYKHILNSDICSTETIQKKLKLDSSTIQRALKKLSEEKVVERYQKNLEKGGYIFSYKIINKEKTRELILSKLNIWLKRVEKEFDVWVKS